MDRTLRNLARVLLVALIVAASFIAFHAYVLATYDRTLSSTYTFEITLEVDAPITNVTLFIPLPEHYGMQSPVVRRLGSGDISGMPDGWVTGIYGTEKATMLKISVDRITPGERFLPLPTADSAVPEPVPEATPVILSTWISLQADADGLIDTRNPVGNASVIMPKYNLTAVLCSFPHENENPPVCYSYETVVYADYRAPDDTRLTLSVRLEGMNEWFVFGWSGNLFVDGFTFAHTGESHGWQAVNGTLMTGIGRYEIL
jgi:hypothetical protein